MSYSVDKQENSPIDKIIVTEAMVEAVLGVLDVFQTSDVCPKFLAERVAQAVLSERSAPL